MRKLDTEWLSNFPSIPQLINDVAGILNQSFWYLCLMFLLKKKNGMEGWRFKIESVCSRKTAGELTHSLHPWLLPCIQLCLRHKSQHKNINVQSFCQKSFHFNHCNPNKISYIVPPYSQGVTLLKTHGAIFEVWTSSWLVSSLATSCSSDGLLLWWQAMLAKVAGG